MPHAFTKLAIVALTGSAVLLSPLAASTATAAGSPVVTSADSAQWYDQGRFPNATCEAKKQSYLSQNIPARCDPIPPLPNVYEELWVFWDPG